MQPLDCQEVLLCSFPQVQLVCVAETGLSLSKLLRLDAACLLELVNIGVVQMLLAQALLAQEMSRVSAG